MSRAAPQADRSDAKASRIQEGRRFVHIVLWQPCKTIGPARNSAFAATRGAAPTHLRSKLPVRIPPARKIHLTNAHTRAEDSASGFPAAQPPEVRASGRSVPGIPFENPSLTDRRDAPHRQPMPEDTSVTLRPSDGSEFVKPTECANWNIRLLPSPVGSATTVVPPGGVESAARTAARWPTLL